MDERLLIRAAVLVLTIAAAGCYNPSLAPCQIACANGLCPDGLECNGQNACAQTKSSTCDDLPIDAAIDGANTRVTIEVHDRFGMPLAAAVVIFTDSAGALVAEMPTGADGIASVDMLPGGAATIVRPVPRSNGLPGTDTSVTTYLDLWPGAHVITQAEVDNQTRNVIVSMNPPPTTTAFVIYASCANALSSSQRSVQFQVPVRCATFDVFVTAGTTSGPTHAAFLAAQTTTNVTIPDASWLPTRPLPGNLMGLPMNSFTRTLEARGWVTATLPAAPTTISSTSPAPAGAVNLPAMPTGVGLDVQLTVTHQLVVGGPVFRQHVYDRVPAAQLNLDRNYNNTLMNWLGDPAMDLTTRTMSWPIYIPSMTVLTTPTFFTAIVSYSHDSTTSVIWRLIGAPSRIIQVGANQSITYPDIPGVRAFEPISADTVNYNAINAYNVEAAAAHELIETIEPAGYDFGYFKIPTLRHVTISIGQ